MLSVKNHNRPLNLFLPGERMQAIIRSIFQRFLVGLVIFPLIIGTACSLPQSLIGRSEENPGAVSSSDPELNNEDPGAVHSNENELEAEPEVRFQSEDYVAPQFPIQNLGIVSFEEDTSAAVEKLLGPGDTDFALQVTDASASTWSLSIPEGALESTQTIRMTPLSHLDSSGMNEPFGEMISGVRLEPDGLTFLKPVSISVSTANSQPVTFILAGSQSGSEVGYTLQDPSATQPTAHIFHFSTYFASQPGDEKLSQIEDNALQEYKRLTVEAKKILKSSLDVPTPPSIPLECPDNETAQKNGEKLTKFVENATNPEIDLILQLLQQRTILELTGNKTRVDDWGWESALANRIGRKAISLMDEFQGKEEKLVAVSQFAINAARKLSLLSGDQEIVQQILSRLANWNASLIDKLINDIHKNHNYKKIPVVWMIARDAELLGAGNNTNSFLEKLKNVLQFELEYTFEVNMADILMTTNLVVPLQFEADQGVLFQCSGAGQGTYSQAEVDDEDVTVQTFPYPVQVQIKEFDPCNGTVMIGIDRFASDNDTMTMTTEDFVETRPWPLAFNASQSLFEDEKAEGIYWFKLPLENESATAVDETIERSKFDTVSGKLTIKLMHK